MMRKKNKTGLLECKVGARMFEGERVVAIHVHGKTISAIVEERSIEEQALRVDICDMNKKTKEILVRVPGESFTTRKIWVPKEMVR